ncbi:MAG: class B sortase [Lachnospiraceae bacterium]|nr:class B sortase [Lachnospiraceae bacterium]
MSKKRWIIVAVLILAAGICAGVAISQISGASIRKLASYSDIPEEEETEDAEEEAEEAEETAQASVEEEPETVKETEEEDYESPIDFVSLQEINEDVYAWIDIPGTEISYPILQHPTDEEYYLKRDIEGNYDSNGSIFSQASYNTNDMTDPVTVFYGHNMKSGAMFGNLEETYSDAEKFAEYNEIVIYLPEEELHYQIFAAVPYSNIHILDYYNMNNENRFETFIDTIWSARGFGVNLDESVDVSWGDRIIVLSTCQSGGSTRYLVLAKLIDDDIDDQ